MIKSLRGRLLLVATLVLAIFLGLTGFVLDRAFRDSVTSAEQVYLQGLIYGLLADAELSESGGLEFPSLLSESRFALPGSGLYALAFDDAGVKIWRSPSLIGLGSPSSYRVKPGQRAFEQIELQQREYFALSYGVEWEDETGQVFPITFVVIEDLGRYHDQINAFRGSLVTWLSLAATVLILIQLAVVRWGLRPLTQIAGQVSSIEKGRQESIVGNYPTELQPLARNLNALIHNERSHLTRYRNTLDDLAHSLKTPLAVMRSELEEPDNETTDALDSQITRMTDIVNHQLRRAATAGTTVMMAPVSVHGVVAKVTNSLGKVYADKQVQITTDIETDILFYGEQGDLYEIVGNCLDNAYKWCTRRVNIKAQSLSDKGVNRNGLMLVIEDDGPGLDPNLIDVVLDRGTHSASERGEHGIGLATVKDIVDSYGGSINLDKATLGGLYIQIVIQPAQFQRFDEMR